MRLTEDDENIHLSLPFKSVALQKKKKKIFDLFQKKSSGRLMFVQLNTNKELLSKNKEYFHGE